MQRAAQSVRCVVQGSSVTHLEALVRPARAVFTKNPPENPHACERPQERSCSAEALQKYKCRVDLSLTVQTSQYQHHHHHHHRH
jgi:hypothetical protein